MIDDIGYNGPIIVDLINLFYFAIKIPTIFFIVLIAMILNHSINKLLKDIFKVPRQKQIPFHGKIAKCYAMPSGHAQAVSFGTTLMYFFNTKIFIACFIILLCTLRQRYVYKNHTAFQLLVGLILGIFFAFGLMFFLQKS